MAVGQTGESPHAHTVGEIEPLDMGGAYPVFIAITEDRQFLSAYYPSQENSGWFPACWNRLLLAG